jgi:hypothetical protein
MLAAPRPRTANRSTAGKLCDHLEPSMRPLIRAQGGVWHVLSRIGASRSTKRPMSGRRMLMAGLAVGALMVALSVPSSASAAFFRTPSGNIICGTGPQAFGGGVSCTVLSEANARGQKIWAMRRRGRVRVFRSRSNAPVEVRVLRYGRTYRGFGIRCVSRRRGLTCRNRSRNGFFLSRGRQRVFRPRR